MIFYHGSHINFDKFKQKPWKAFDNKIVLSPIWLTEDLEFAKIYAGENGWIYKVEANLDKTFPTEPLFKREGNYIIPTEYGEIILNDLVSKNMFGLGADDWHEAEQILKSISALDYDTLETKTMIDWFKENGYDSFKVRGDGPVNTAVLNSKKLKIIDKKPFNKANEILKESMHKTPITPQIINNNLIDKLAEAMNVDIAGMTTQEIQMGMIQELGSMQTYTLEAMNTEKLVKAFFTTYNNLSKDPQYYSKPSPETGHPLKGMQGTQFDTTFNQDPQQTFNLDPSIIQAPGIVNEITLAIFDKLLKESKKYLDMDEFKKLPNDLNAQNNWLETNAKQLGLGSSRAVFLIDSSKVLKVAFDEKGIDQNKVELKVFKNPKFRDILVPIYDFDKNYHWIVSELVRPLEDKKEWEKLAGLPWQSFVDAVKDVQFNQAKKNYPEFIQKIVNFSLKNKILINDFLNVENWGKTSDGRVVILDFGFDAKTRDKHYR